MALLEHPHHHLLFTESLLELIIAKDALKTNSPSLEQVSSHQFFMDSALTFNKTYSDSLASSKLSFEPAAKEAIQKASQKTEQRLKDEQKLVNFLDL